MKKELILSLEDKEKKRRKIQANRAMKPKISDGLKNYKPMKNVTSPQENEYIK